MTSADRIAALRRYANPNWIGGSGPDRDDVVALLREYDKLVFVLSQLPARWSGVPHTTQALRDDLQYAIETGGFRGA